MRLPRRAERDPARAFVEGNIPRKTGFQTVSAHTLGAVKDKGTGAENLVWLASRQRGRADPASLAADDILARLTARIAELEARVSAILADVEPEPPRVNSERGRAASAPNADAGGGTGRPNRDARVEADDELTRASEERRTLANEMRLLREAIQEARSGQPFAGLGAKAVEARVAPDLRAAIADEMRILLVELFADFRSRAIAPPPVEDVPAKPAAIVEEVVESQHTAALVVDPIAAASPPIVEHIDELVRPITKTLIDESIEDRQATPPPIDTPADVVAPIETSESIVEHVDELVRPITKPLIDNSVADRSEPEPVARLDASPVEAASDQPAAAIVEEYEEFFRAEPAPSIEVAELQIAASELVPPIVEEHVFGPAEPVAPIIDEFVEEVRPIEAPPLETIELSAAAAEPIAPIIDEFIEELHRPEAPPLETIEQTAANAEPAESIVDEFVEAPPQIEIVEDVFRIEATVDDYVVPTSDFTITPPVAPAAPDLRLAALWDAAPLPTAPETPPPSEAEPASFVSEDVVAQTPPLDVPEEVYPPQELAPEQTIDYAPPPIDYAPAPVEFVAPPVEFAPEPPAILEPQPSPEPPITEARVEPSFSSLYPELTVADERGLHQIQVVISPIHSFPRLLETERRIRMLSTVNALHLRDFRNGVATLTVSVAQAISPAEFGAVIQMLESLHLRLEGTTQSSVELRAEDEPPSE